MTLCRFSQLMFVAFAAGCAGSPATPLSWLDYMERGHTAMQHELYEQAIAEYTLAVKLTLYRPFAYISRAQAYTSAGMFAEAEADFSKAIEKASHPLAIAYHERGALYLRMGDQAKAERDLEFAKRLDPTGTLGVQ